MRTTAVAGRHLVGAVTEAMLIAVAIAITIAAVALIANPNGSVVPGAQAARLGSIQVSWPAARDASATDSHFVVSGCGFRASDANHYLVIRGPAPDTTSLAFWVDPFVLGQDGCGSTTPSWTGSGVPGTFEAYVVRSPAGNPWQAHPVSNVLAVTVTAP